MTLSIRAGMGMKKQVWVGYRVSNKFQLLVGHESTENATRKHWITGDVIHRHKGLDYVSTTTSNFPWPQKFSAFLPRDELQIN